MSHKERDAETQRDSKNRQEKDILLYSNEHDAKDDLKKDTDNNIHDNDDEADTVSDKHGD